MSDLSPPVVIGGSGGSGTRVLAELLIMSGYYMGEHRNVSCDALDFFAFYDHWLNRYNFGRNVMSPLDESAMRDDFNLSLTRFKGAVSLSKNRAWGWKNPRSMLMLPFLNSVLSDVKFIHLVRDGRDMAWSKNKNQFEKHAGLVLSGAQKGLSSEAKAMRFWSESNMLVAAYGEDFMAERYIRVRFKDLCLNTEKTLCCLELFLGRSVDGDEFSAFIHTPKSVGRWLDKSDSIQSRFVGHGEKAMRHFAYLD